VAAHVLTRCAIARQPGVDGQELRADRGRLLRAGILVATQTRYRPLQPAAGHFLDEIKGQDHLRYVAQHRHAYTEFDEITVREVRGESRMRSGRD
jgi:hypothetical protein